MTTKEQIKQVLESWKFPVVHETDNTVAFRYQMNYIQINIIGREDDNALTVTLTGCFAPEDEKQMLLGLKTCNELNCYILHAKLYFDSDADLTIAAEFFHKTPEDLEYLLTMALRSIIAAKKQFTKKYNEFVEEAKLISELEQE